MQKNFEVKHNLRGAFFLAFAVSGSLSIVFLVLIGLQVPYIKDIPILNIFLPILFIGIYIMWSNYYLRKIIVNNEKCIYVNMFGQKKEFRFDDIKKIKGDSNNVILYDNKQMRICKLEENMENLEELQYFVYIKKGVVAKCSLKELEDKVEKNYSNFTNCLKSFFSDKESLGIILEYGFQIEEKENKIFYILKFRAKNGEGYLAQNFLKMGYREYKIVFIGYNQDREMIFYCEKEKLNDYIKKLYRNFARLGKRKRVLKKCSFAPYERMEQINI